MDVLQSLIPGLGDVMGSTDPARKSAAIRQIGRLFAQGAPGFSTRHVALFDDVLTGLMPHSDPAARADLALQLAPLPNAPPNLIHRLVHDDVIDISGPLLGRSPLIAEKTLIEIARMKGQPHLMAMSGRATLTSSVTDVIVRRGERDVVRHVAANAGAAFSPAGFSGLLRRADQDGALALAVGQRSDLSDANFRNLLDGSVDIVRRRLLAGASAARRESIGLTEPAARNVGLKRRDFAPAQKAILALHKAGSLDEPAVLEAATRGDYETTVAALSALSGAQIATIDHLMCGERHDPLLVLGRAIGFEWTTVRTLVALRPVDIKLSSRAYDDARHNYERLLRPTAQRVLGFWRMRQPDMAAS